MDGGLSYNNKNLSIFHATNNNIWWKRVVNEQ